MAPPTTPLPQTFNNKVMSLYNAGPEYFMELITRRDDDTLYIEKDVTVPKASQKWLFTCIDVSDNLWRLESVAVSGKLMSVDNGFDGDAVNTKPQWGNFHAQWKAFKSGINICFQEEVSGLWMKFDASNLQKQIQIGQWNDADSRFWRYTEPKAASEKSETTEN